MTTPAHTPPTQSPGLDQATARRRAKELGGIAVSARRGSTGRWITGGWPHKNDVWIVVSLSGRTVMDDGSASADSARSDS